MYAVYGINNRRATKNKKKKSSCEVICYKFKIVQQIDKFQINASRNCI